MRPLSACVQVARGPAWPLLRARPARRRGRAPDVRPLERLLRRPDREEATEPFPARQRRLLLRHRRLQPRLPLLPELGHLEVSGDGHAGGRGFARGDRSSCGEARLRERRVHLQRSGDLPRIRRRRRRRLPGARHQDGGGDRRLRLSRAVRRVLCAHGRGEHRPEGFQRRLLPPRLCREPPAGARHARVPRRGDPASGSRSRRC